MTVSYVEILGDGGASRPHLLPLTRHTRDALAKYCELRWPYARQRHVAREWGLTRDQARAVCEASASAATIDAIWKHPNGGWGVLVPVLGAVIGQSFDSWLNQEQGRLARARRELEAQEGRMVALADRARALAALPAPGSYFGDPEETGGVAAVVRRAAARHHRGSESVGPGGDAFLRPDD